MMMNNKFSDSPEHTEDTRKSDTQGNPAKYENAEKSFDALFGENRVSEERRKIESISGELQEKGSTLKKRMQTAEKSFDALFAEKDVSELSDEEVDEKQKDSISQVDYETLLNALSLAVLLDEFDCGKEIVKKHGTFVKEDKLLHLLSEYLYGEELTWEGSFYLPDVYDSLDIMKRSDDKEGIIKKYLEDWYLKRASCSWYDSDKKDTETYYGYWCFEAAALIKAFSLKDSVFCKNEYYPMF